ncbi:hypothetical protein AVEN_268372-1, partial [Araneus ventricosus]
MAHLGFSPTSPSDKTALIGRYPLTRSMLQCYGLIENPVIEYLDFHSRRKLKSDMKEQVYEHVASNATAVLYKY